MSILAFDHANIRLGVMELRNSWVDLAVELKGTGLGLFKLD